MALSDRQINILRYIAEFVDERSYPPTIRQIGTACAISSTSVVKYNLSKLENEELIVREAEVSRGLSLNWEKLEAAGLLEEIRGPVGHAIKGASDRVISFFSVPVLGHIAAGEPIQVDPTDYAGADEWIDLNEALFRDREKLFALRVQGDSMVDASVLDGDIVILRRQERAENGEMVAAWIDGLEETTLKRFYVDDKKTNLVHLRPANPAYREMTFPASQVSVMGKVVSVIRQLE